MTPTNTYAEELAKAIKIMEFIERTRFTTAPEDYPPSEWQQYQRVTKDIKKARIKLSELYMLI